MKRQIRISFCAAIGVLGLAFATSSVQSAELLTTWVYPSSQLAAKGGPDNNTSSFTQSESFDVRSSDDAIRKVVAYYVRRSGFEPPNWKILGKEFPYPDHLPVGFWMGPGEVDDVPARVSITHDLRPDVAHVSFLIVTEAGALTSISITRGKNEDKTWIQIHQHGFKAMGSSQRFQRTEHRDRGPDYSGTPPTPPSKRVRTRRFDSSQ
jgi:hypothetical protein